MNGENGHKTKWILILLNILIPPCGLKKGGLSLSFFASSLRLFVRRVPSFHFLARKGKGRVYISRKFYSLLNTAITSFTMSSLRRQELSQYYWNGFNSGMLFVGDFRVGWMIIVLVLFLFFWLFQWEITFVTFKDIVRTRPNFTTIPENIRATFLGPCLSSW